MEKMELFPTISWIAIFQSLQVCCFYKACCLALNYFVQFVTVINSFFLIFIHRVHSLTAVHQQHIHLSVMNVMKERLEFFDSWALYWLGLRWGSVRKCLTPFWLLWEAMCCEKKQKGQALISKEDAPHEGKRERANTICHVRALPLNHFPVKLRSHCEWDKERVAEIGHPRAGQMWLRLSIFFSNWVFGNLGLTGNMVLINDYLVKNREHFSFHNEIGERLC